MSISTAELSAVQFKEILTKLLESFTEEPADPSDSFLIYKEDLKTAIEESIYLWSQVAFDRLGNPVTRSKELVDAFEWFHWITSERYATTDRGMKEGYGLCLDCMRNLGLGL